MQEEKPMDDTEILKNITELVNEEHELMNQSEGVGLDAEQEARMKSLEVSLDQCWDLLRQRRARRHAGLNPDEAQVRDPGIVEHYQQ
jgi:peptide deformylase